MSFTKDLAFGKTWEATAMSIVGGGEPGPSGRFKPYDFTHHGIKYEVKADRLAYKYGGNTMFVEYECSGQPSGISTTEADVWMYFMVHPNGSYQCYSIHVSDLKARCAGCPVKSGGDGYRSRGYIVPVRTSERTPAVTQGSLPSESDLRIRLPVPPPITPSPAGVSSTPLGSRTSPLSPLPAVLLG